VDRTSISEKLFEPHPSEGLASVLLYSCIDSGTMWL